METEGFKGSSHEWLNGEVVESMAIQDKVSKKFMCMKLNVDKEIYDKVHNETLTLIS